MPLALVTGNRPQVGSAAANLARAGFNVVTWETASRPPPAEGPFDCYVQLPCDRAGTPEDLVCRIDGLAAVAGRLRPAASIILGVDGPGAVAPDLLASVALALLEDIGRPAARLAVLPVADLCRRAPVSGPLDLLVGAGQWEMPTPPLVSAP